MCQGAFTQDQMVYHVGHLSKRPGPKRMMQMTARQNYEFCRRLDELPSFLVSKLNSFISSELSQSSDPLKLKIVKTLSEYCVYLEDEVSEDPSIKYFPF